MERLYNKAYKCSLFIMVVKEIKAPKANQNKFFYEYQLDRGELEYTCFKDEGQAWTFSLNKCHKTWTFLQ